MQTVEAGGLPIGDGHPPRVMGVLNVSEQSPYSPSVFADPEAAARYVDEELIAEGADIVDVGLESANKRFEVLSADEELERLDTALEVLELVEGDAVFSIETRYHEVAAAALDGGYDMVNDICGFADPELPDVCAQRNAAVVKMASPPDIERPGAVETVDEIYDALERGGLTERTIVDPAFGGWSEAKTLEHDRETFRRLREFRALDRPILVSINRKNFLRELAGRETEAALPVSLAATSMAVERGAHVIRTHDVAETRDAALVGAAFSRERTRTALVEELDVTTTAEARRQIVAIGGGELVEADGGRSDSGGETTPGAFATERRDTAGTASLDATAAAASVGCCVAVGASAETRSAVAALADELAGLSAVRGPEKLFLGGTVSSFETLAGELADGDGEKTRVGRALARVA